VTKSESAQAPIGVFDSGLGGLTVLRAIRARLPQEDLVYLGDSARVPYGTRSARTVLSYARGCARRLGEHDMKLLVVACNTVSAVALDQLTAELDVPVLGVIVPGARAGVARSESGRIGVMATPGTVDSGAYPRAITAQSASAQAFMAAAPLLVPLTEEGWTDGEVPRLVVRRYLAPLVQAQIDTLVLGCTHYPVLREVIAAELQAQSGHAIPVVDSAEATASDLADLLRARGMLATRPQGGNMRLLVTDLPRRFAEVAGRFLGQSVDALPVEAIDL
jgi:glutamate racemase